MLPDIFKYASLISVPVFATIALVVIRNAPSFSIKKHTLSQSILHITNPYYSFLFKANFILKALLDFSYAVFLLNTFKIPIISPIAFFLFASTLIFGSLAHFVEGKYTGIHAVLVYLSGVLWVIGQILLTKQVTNTSFFYFTIIMLMIPVIVGFSLPLTKKSNAIMQTVCVILFTSWLTVFIIRYL